VLIRFRNDQKRGHFRNKSTTNYSTNPNHIGKLRKYLHNSQTKDMDNRIERLRVYIDDILLHMKDNEERRCAYLHLYGVSQACTMIALKRNQD